MRITISNHQDFKDLDIVAFSYAFSGAMGDPGSVVIVLADGTVHYANFPHNELVKCLEKWK